MKHLRKVIAAIILLQAFLGDAVASGAGTVAGLTLLEAPTARAAALGQSMVAGSNDIAVLGYNPAGLATMKSGQASFLYQKGLIDDSYGHFLIGSPSKNGGVGLSIGFYNGGEFELSDGSGVSRSAVAQRDLAISLAAARQVGRFSIGTTAKYISSEIAETAKATAYAADFGLSMAAGKSLRLGASVQNIGTQLKYVSRGDDLPRMAHLGAAYSFRPAGMAASLLLDGTYRMVEKEFEPAAGFEIGLGVLALRVGYRGGSTKEVTAGTGFFMGRSSIDYSFGMAASDLDASHRISYSLRFGGRPSMATQLASAARKISAPAASAPAAPVSVNKASTAEISSSAPSKTAVDITPVGVVRRIPRSHEIKPGETLASIARDQYGDARLWRRIYQANSHILPDPTQVEIGRKIVLP